MALEVEILSIDESGSTLDIAVSVQTESVETIDYVLNINDTGTGGTVTRSGTLVGGAGSYPGDANIEDVSFGIGDTSGGTITAQITEPEEYVGVQDQEKWGGQGPVEVNSCEAGATSGGDLSVSYTLVPPETAGKEAEIGVRVDGQRVGSASHFVPGRGGNFSQTISGSQLPVGQDMPVEIEVGGNL